VPAHCAAPRIPWRLLGDRFAIGCPLIARHLASCGVCSAIASRSGARSLRGTSHPVALLGDRFEIGCPLIARHLASCGVCSAIASRSGARSLRGIPRRSSAIGCPFISGISWYPVASGDTD